MMIQVSFACLLVYCTFACDSSMGCMTDTLDLQCGLIYCKMKRREFLGFKIDHFA